RTAVAPQWRTDRAHTCAARSLLLPELLACAGNQLLVLGGVRAAVLPGAVMLHRFPKQVFVHRTEHFIGQFERTDFLAIQVHYIDCRHKDSLNLSGLPTLLWVPHPCGDSHRVGAPTHYFFFATARFEAFNGSTVVEPANPRRSLGGRFDLVMYTVASLCPGTAPSTINRFSSLSIPRMRRFRTVTWSVPMWPAMRMPLNTRDGN